MEALVGLVLPLGCGGVAEEHAAAEGADAVDAAELVCLEWAAGAVPLQGAGNGLQGAQFVDEGRQFHCGDEQAMAELFKLAASAGDDAEGTPGVDLALNVFVNPRNGTPHLR